MQKSFFPLCDLSLIDLETLGLLLKSYADCKDKKSHNIIFATDEYKDKGVSFFEEMTVQTLQTKHIDIVPRHIKEEKKQQTRTRQKAEVATPFWICKAQNDLIENATKEKQKDPFDFLVDFLEETYLEVSCGEAPYLVSRYDVATGKTIKAKDRVGVLDRKLRLVSSFAKEKGQWKELAKKAYKSVFGFEYQGDSLFLARCNLLFSFLEHYIATFGGEIQDFSKEPLAKDLKEIAKIISLNLFQMDGLKGVIPCSCTEIEKEDTVTDNTQDFFCPCDTSDTRNTKKIMKVCYGCKTNDMKQHNGIYARIMDWKTGKLVKFVDLFC